jgi:hypothetical protein
MSKEKLEKYYYGLSEDVASRNESIKKCLEGLSVTEVSTLLRGVTKEISDETKFNLTN